MKKILFLTAASMLLGTAAADEQRNAELQLEKEAEAFEKSTVSTDPKAIEALRQRREWVKANRYKYYQQGRAGCTSGFFCSGSAGRRYRESSRTGGVSTAGSCSRTGCLPRAGSGRTGAGSSGMSAIVCCTGCGRRLRPFSISSGISAVSCRQ